jgi:hypothetical protein
MPFSLEAEGAVVSKVRTTLAELLTSSRAVPRKGI